VSGERRIRWADGLGLLPHGVRHLRVASTRQGRSWRRRCSPDAPSRSSQRPPSGSRCPTAGPRRATGPLGGPAAGGPNDGVNGYTGMMVCRTSAHPRLHGGGQPAVVSRGQGKPRSCHAEWLLHLAKARPRATITNLTRVLIHKKVRGFSEYICRDDHKV